MLKMASSVGATLDDKLASYNHQSMGRHEDEEEHEEQEECSRRVSKEGDQIESAKAKMTEVREENARLKMLLDKIETDYKSLQMRFTDVFQPPHVGQERIDEEPELVSLSLGRTRRRDEAPKKEGSSGIAISKGSEDEIHSKEGLKLGLKCYYDYEGPKPESTEKTSPENRLVETKEEEAGETWPPSKVLKTVKSSGDDDLSQASVKRARVSVRARCETPTMNDGCQWRKYGQKIAKGNPCPRAYYRCTVAPSCPVRKQVQRCSEDMSILITTYEGTHNHPLPISATAMASTTSAAASMLLSGSSTSQSGLGSASATNLPSTYHGLNANPSENSKTRSFYLPNSSPPFPTITLDLTTSAPTTSSAHLNMFSTSFQSTSRFPSASLSFSSSQPNVVLPTVWGKGNLNNYGAILPYNKTTGIVSNLQPAARPSSQEQQHYQPNLQKNYQAFPPQVLTDTLTKAITSDPSFRTVIAAALSTVVGGGGSMCPAQANNKAESFGTHLK